MSVFVIPFQLTSQRCSMGIKKPQIEARKAFYGPLQSLRKIKCPFFPVPSRGSLAAVYCVLGSLGFVCLRTSGVQCLGTLLCPRLCAASSRKPMPGHRSHIIHLLGIGAAFLAPFCSEISAGSSSSNREPGSAIQRQIRSKARRAPLAS